MRPPRQRPFSRRRGEPPFEGAPAALGAPPCRPALLCRANSDLRLERTAQGDLIVMAPAGSESGGRNAVLTTRLGVWTEADGTGVSFDSSAGFKFPNGATRSPDASWIRKERWEALTPSESRGFAPICPDFAVELCSPSDEPGRRARPRGDGT